MTPRSAAERGPGTGHQLVNDDHLHECVCGDWHPGSFYAEATAAVPLDVERLALHSDDDDCQPPHVHRHHWVDVLYPGDKVWFYCTGCEERRIKPAAEYARLASADEETP